MTGPVRYSWNYSDVDYFCSRIASTELVDATADNSSMHKTGRLNPHGTIKIASVQPKRKLIAKVAGIEREVGLLYPDTDDKPVKRIWCLGIAKTKYSGEVFSLALYQQSMQMANIGVLG